LPELSVSDNAFIGKTATHIEEVPSPNKALFVSTQDGSFSIPKTSANAI
jgi:hypothetical protein